MAKKRPAKKRPTPQPTAKEPLNPAALRPAELAGVLSSAGEAVSEADIHADLEAGAPANPDGTVHLIQYTAWLASQVK